MYDNSSSNVYTNCLILLLRDLVELGFGVLYITSSTVTCMPLHSRVNAVLMHMPHRAP